MAIVGRIVGPIVDKVVSSLASNLLSGTSLSFDFLGPRKFDSLTGPNLTLSRSSGGMQYNAQGYREYANENLLLNSEDPSAASWSRLNVTVSASTETAPEGYQQAWIFNEGSTAGVEHRLDDGFTAQAGVYYQGEVVLKSGSATSALVFFGGATVWGGQTPGLTANLANGTISSSVTSGIVNLGNGWYKVWFSFLAVADGTPSLRVMLQNGSYTGTNRTVLLTGAKVCRSVTPKDYIRTTSSAVYTPRLDYNPNTMELEGYLMEKQITNLLLNSNNFSVSPWNGSDRVITANSGIGATGLQDMDLITEGATGTSSNYQEFTITAGQTLSASIDLKKGTVGDWVRLQVSDAASSTGFRLWFNMTTGALGTSSAFGTGTITGTSVVYCSATGVHRVSLTGTVDNATTAVRFFQISASADNSTTRTLNSNRYQGNAQVEVGTCATSVIFTSGTQTTRAADVASTTEIGWYNQTQGTFFIECKSFDDPQTAVSVLSVDDNTTNNRMYVRIFNSGNSLFVVSTGGVSQASIGQAGATTNQTQRFANSYSTNNFNFTRNGNTVTSDTSGTVPSGLTTFRLGSDPGVTRNNVWIRRLGYWPYQRQNIELQSITT